MRVIRWCWDCDVSWCTESAECWVCGKPSLRSDAPKLRNIPRGTDTPPST